MDKDRWKKIEDLFEEAAELEPAERAGFLAATCGDDTELREEIEALLAEAGNDSDIFDSPTWDLGLRIIAARADELVGTYLGHYRIVSRLGSGGMGEVFLAEDTRLKRKVALKLLSQTLTDPTSLSRFKFEARAASGISHPNITHVYDIGEERGLVFIAMEFVDGPTLREKLASGSIDRGQVVDIARQIALAINAAHLEGVVHRDIKPENVIVRSDGLIKVLDFGLAKFAGSASTDPFKTRIDAVHTDPQLVIGTMTYMSPEQARGRQVDVRTDIWSWGVVVYEMLSGKAPFAGDTGSDTIAEILKTEPDFEVDLFPDGLREILLRALAKDPDARYQTMSDVLSDLNAFDPDTRRHISGSTKIADVGSRRDRNAAAGSGIPNWMSRLTSPIKRPVLLFATVAAVLVLAGVFGFKLSSDGDRKPNNPVVKFLTRDGRVMDAAISPDGSSLVYVPVEAGKQSIWIRTLSDGSERELLPAEEVRRWGMRFTPDGRNVLFVQAGPDSTSNVLYRLAVTGGPPSKILVGLAGPAAISPDGMRIAFVRRDPSTSSSSIIVANIDGSSEKKLATRTAPETFSDGSLSWSPDARTLAVGAGRKNDAELAVLGYALNGGDATELTPWQWAAVGGMSWDNDGRTLIVSARPIGSRVFQLWKIGNPDKTITPLLSDGNAFEEVTLSSVSHTIVATHTYEVSDLWAVDAAGNSRRLTTQSNVGADGITVSPPGAVVYTSGEYEASSIWSMDTASGTRRQLTPASGFLPTASEDGRLVAYVAIVDGVRHIRAINSDGTNDRALTDGSGENSPSLTPDGSWVVYASVVKDVSSLWKVPTDGGEPVRLTRGAVFIKPIVSPDGTRIACTFRRDQSDNWKIGILSIDGGTVLQSFSFPGARAQMIRWNSDGSGLIYTVREAGADNLWLQPLDGSAPTRLTNFTQDFILHHDYIPATGEYVLSRGGRRRDIALIQNY
jgi:serine/threonine protein kinase/Tol biopolymer transport system component